MPVPVVWLRQVKGDHVDSSSAIYSVIRRSFLWTIIYLRLPKVNLLESNHDSDCVMFGICITVHQEVSNND